MCFLLFNQTIVLSDLTKRELLLQNDGQITVKGKGHWYSFYLCLTAKFERQIIIFT